MDILNVSHPCQLVNVCLQFELLVRPAPRQGRLDQTLIVIQRSRQLASPLLQRLKVTSNCKIQKRKTRLRELASWQ